MFVILFFLCPLELILIMNSDISKVAYRSTVLVVPFAEAFSV